MIFLSKVVTSRGIGVLAGGDLLVIYHGDSVCIT